MREADAEGHTVCDSIDRKRPEHANPQRQESGLVIARGWGNGMGRDSLKVTGFYFVKTEIF